MKRPVRIEDYNPQWPTLFENEKLRILAVTGQHIIRVEHIGSTAVVGLGAKPIIDMMIAVNSLSDADKCIKPLESVGYRYIAEHEESMPERRYFNKGKPPKEQHYHIHMVELSSCFWNRHLLFRDYLRKHPETARKYHRLKKRLAAEHHTNRDSYTSAKTSFIEKTIAKAKAERQDACLIKAEKGKLL